MLNNLMHKYAKNCNAKMIKDTQIRMTENKPNSEQFKWLADDENIKATPECEIGKGRYDILIGLVLRIIIVSYLFILLMYNMKIGL